MAKYPFSSKQANHDDLSELSIVLLYATFAAAWIIFSDKAVEALFSAQEEIILAGTLKGWLFVAVTSLLLYGLLRHRRRKKADAAAADTAHPAELVAWPRWALYAFAVAVSVTTLLIRTQIEVAFHNRPLLIVLMFPVIISAIIGGGGPGLLATLIVSGGAVALAASTAHGMDMIAGYDFIHWGFLIVNGALVSVLAELMRRSWGRANAALAERLKALRLLEAISNNSEDAIFAHDRSSHFILFNRAAERITGKSAQAVLGHDETRLFPPDMAQKRIADNYHVMESGISRTFEEDILTPEGERTILVVKTPLRDEKGEIVGLFGIVRDITERKLAETALRESERRFHDIVEASADWVWEVDAEGRYIYASESVQELLGYTAEEIIGKTPFDLMPPAEAKRVRAEFAVIAAKRKPFRDLDNVNVRKDGSLRHVQTNGMPILDAAGNLLGYRGLERDVTEAKLAELELRNRNEELERFNRAMVGRELDMIALKRQVNELASRLGDEEPYRLDFADSPGEAAKGKDIP